MYNREQGAGSREQGEKVDVILVPQGPEYQAVRQGLSQTTSNHPLVLPIPIGSDALKAYLEKWKKTQDFLNKPPSRILLMGLGGSLSLKYQVGESVLYQGCINLNGESWQECALAESEIRYADRHFTSLLHQRLAKKISLVRGLTSDRLIWSAEEKSYLGQKYQADVVDMEGFTVLEMLNPAGIAVAIVRVISDNSMQTLPNLTSAFSADGSLKPFPLAIGMIKQPLAAVRLIRGSLRGLKRLQQITHELVISQ